MNGPAFKCTCPSRQFPCKDGLGPVSCRRPSRHYSRPAPNRNGSATGYPAGRCARKRSPTTPPPSHKTRKREEKREDKIDAGMRGLQIWLHVLAREGLAAVRSRGQGMWDGIVARMADAQAAPLARGLRRAGSFLYQSSLRNGDTRCVRSPTSVRRRPTSTSCPAPMRMRWPSSPSSSAIRYCWRV